MYSKINDVTFYNMTDRDKFVYLIKKTLEGTEPLYRINFGYHKQHLI